MYLVIGANGFLGSYIIKAILESTNEDIIATYSNSVVKTNSNRVEWIKLDVTNESDIDNLNLKLNKRSIKVVYLAAYHNPDLVEKNPKIGWHINITSLSNFLNKIDNVECFFYPSTDSVYGESQEMYHFKEEDILKPVNKYGHQKIAAETLVREYGYNVVRYPFLIGPSLLGHKKHFYDKIVEQILDGKEMDMFADSYRSSLDFATAAQLLVDLIENYSEDIPKTLNLSGDEDLSKYDIGLMIAKKIGVNQNLIKSIYLTDDSDIFLAQRANTTLLDNFKLKKVLNKKNIRIKI